MPQMSKEEQEKNYKANLELIIRDIRRGVFFPIMLYGYKIECNCKDSYAMIYGDTREKVVNDFKECPICKAPYKISEKEIPSEGATLLILRQKDPQIPMLKIANLKPEDINRLAEAGNRLLRSRPYLTGLIKFKLNKLNKNVKEKNNPKH